MKEFIVKGKRYGWIDNGVFKKRVTSTKHKMRVLDAYGIEGKIVKELDLLELTEIRIKEDDTGNVYSVSYEKFKENRFLKNFQTPQYFIQMKYLTKHEAGKPTEEDVPMPTLFE